MKKHNYVLNDPNRDDGWLPAGHLDQKTMTQAEANRRNVKLRGEGSDLRWVKTTKEKARVTLGRILFVEPAKLESREVKTFQEASQVCMNYIDEHGLGASDWWGGTIWQGSTIIAKVSYNGRVWEPEPSENEITGDRLHEAL